MKVRQYSFWEEMIMKRTKMGSIRVMLTNSQTILLMREKRLLRFRQMFFGC